MSNDFTPGTVFGYFTIIEKLPRDEKGKYRALCRCVCGKEKSPETYHLKNGKSTSCGCRGGNTKYSKVIPGVVFYRLTVVERIKTEDGRLTERVSCRCECGKETKSNIDGLISGKVKSCGCWKNEQTAKRNVENRKYTPEEGWMRRNWYSMVRRCCVPKDSTYPQYGGKGIKVCNYLKEDYKNLISIIGPKTKEKFTIDRFPIHNGNYTCGQCEDCKNNNWKLNIRWATKKTQSENRGSFNKHLTLYGVTKILSQWETLSGLREQTISKRLKRGWNIWKTLRTPDAKGFCITDKQAEQLKKEGKLIAEQLSKENLPSS